MHRQNDIAPNRRDVLLGGTALTAAGMTFAPSFEVAQAQQSASSSVRPPNILCFLVDNLGYGELGC